MDRMSFQAAMPRLFAVYSRQWILFSLIRVGTFAVALAILLLLGVNVFVAALGAAVIGFCVSYIFLRKQRDARIRELEARLAELDDDQNNSTEK